jgi:hypothetical protein
MPANRSPAGSQERTQSPSSTETRARWRPSDGARPLSRCAADGR